MSPRDGIITKDQNGFGQLVLHSSTSFGFNYSDPITSIYRVLPPRVSHIRQEGGPRKKGSFAFQAPLFVSKLIVVLFYTRTNKLLSTISTKLWRNTVLIFGKMRGPDFRSSPTRTGTIALTVAALRRGVVSWLPCFLIAAARGTDNV